jgi:hypothetical protein
MHAYQMHAVAALEDFSDRFRMSATVVYHARIVACCPSLLGSIRAWKLTQQLVHSIVSRIPDQWIVCREDRVARDCGEKLGYNHEFGLLA